MPVRMAGLDVTMPASMTVIADRKYTKVKDVNPCFATQSVEGICDIPCSHTLQISGFTLLKNYKTSFIALICATPLLAAPLVIAC